MRGKNRSAQPLLTETVKGLNPHPGGVYIDGTLGSAGHAEAIVKAMEGQGLFIGIDRDPEALARAGARLAPYGERVRLVHANFGAIEEVARAAGITQADGIMMDLGVSSNQIGTPERGFSFQDDGLTGISKYNGKPFLFEFGHLSGIIFNHDKTDIHPAENIGDMPPHPTTTGDDQMIFQTLFGQVHGLMNKGSLPFVPKRIQRCG